MFNLVLSSNFAWHVSAYKSLLQLNPHTPKKSLHILEEYIFSPKTLFLWLPFCTQDFLPHNFLCLIPIPLGPYSGSQLFPSSRSSGCCAAIEGRCCYKSLAEGNHKEHSKATITEDSERSYWLPKHPKMNFSEIT